MVLLYELIRGARISKETSTPLLYINGAGCKAIRRKDDANKGVNQSPQQNANESDERRARGYHRVRGEELKTKHDTCDRTKRAMTHNMRGRERAKQKECKVRKFDDSYECRATWVHGETMSLEEE